MSNRHPSPDASGEQQGDRQEEKTSRLPEISVYILALKSLILTHPVKAFVISIAVTFALTLLYAWVLNPVTYYGANFADLSEQDQHDIVETMATDVLFDESKPRIVAMARRFPSVTQIACEMADEELRRGDAMNGLRVERLWLLVYEITGVSECQISRR